MENRHTSDKITLEEIKKFKLPPQTSRMDQLHKSSTKDSIIVFSLEDI